MDLINSLDGVEAVFIDTDNNLTYSDNFQNNINKRQGDYFASALSFSTLRFRGSQCYALSHYILYDVMSGSYISDQDLLINSWLRL